MALFLLYLDLTGIKKAYIKHVAKKSGVDYLINYMI